MLQQSGRSTSSWSGHSILVSILVLCAFTATCRADVDTAPSFAAGNLLVVSGSELREYTRHGVLVQSLAIPYGLGERPLSETARDLCFDATGTLAVYDGGYAPDLALYDSERDSWSHQFMAGWSSVNRFGALACSGRWIFATDMSTGDGGELGGILRFDTSRGYTCQRFAPDLNSRDLAADPAGRFRVLISEFDVVTFDPAEMRPQSTLSLERPVRAISVDNEGILLGAAWDGAIHRFDQDGVAIATLSTEVGNLNDLDVDEAGWIAAGSRLGLVVLVQPDFRSWSEIEVGEVPTFVAFIPQGR